MSATNDLIKCSNISSSDLKHAWYGIYTSLAGQGLTLNPYSAKIDFRRLRLIPELKVSIMKISNWKTPFDLHGL